MSNNYSTVAILPSYINCQMLPTVGQYLECKVLDLKIEIITLYKPLHKSEFDVKVSNNILCYCNDFKNFQCGDVAYVQGQHEMPQLLHKQQNDGTWKAVNPAFQVNRL